MLIRKQGEGVELLAISVTLGLCSGGMWTKEDRARYDRRSLRYPSDLTARSGR